MKKLAVLLCMLTCVLGLSACGQEEALDAQMQQRVQAAETISTQFVVPFMTSFFDDETAQDCLSRYNVHEIKEIAESNLDYLIYYYQNTYGQTYDFSEISVDGNAILTGITSFNSTAKALGDIDVSQGFIATSKVSGDEIIVTVPIVGSKTDKNGNNIKANAEILLTNDIFLKVRSISLNTEQTMGDLMGKAAADTLMGMGTVFIVLILISLLIYALGFIPKLMDKLSGKSKKEEMQAIKKDAVNNTIAQIIEKEEQVETVDDCELVAVIAAAIAASMGTQSTDGFVVRSIRKRY